MGTDLSTRHEVDVETKNGENTKERFNSNINFSAFKPRNGFLFESCEGGQFLLGEAFFLAAAPNPGR